MKKVLRIGIPVLLAVLLVSGGVFAVLVSGVLHKSDAQSIDLSVQPKDVPDDLKYLYTFNEVDKIDGYLAHPDSVLLKDGSLLQMYPKGHGRGPILTKLSFDGGLTYPKSLENTPKSWELSEETPTVYRLQFTDGKTSDKLIVISANPDWGDEPTVGGFNCSVSTDEAKTWTEFQLFYPKDGENGVIPIVAMASLTQLKENGKFVDKWMGFFHDRQFDNYKSILTFDEAGNPQWSAPEKYFAQHEAIEKESNMCEVEVIRSEGGQGDELCLLTRSNSKRMNTLISFSADEGKTWSAPREVPDALNGERHKAEYAPDGRLVIAFRSISRDRVRAKLYSGTTGVGHFYSNGPVVWVGTYEDLKNGADGQYRVKLAHTYFDNQKKPQDNANADTGYCGNTVLEDGTFVISTYGKFSPDETYTDADGKVQLKTYIVSKRINLADLDRLAELQKK